MGLQDFKKQASFFLRDKLNGARLALTDASKIQLLAEEATNEDPWGPETRTMAVLADAAFELEEYERIVQVIHGRLDGSKKRPWRQLFKTLVVLEYLLTHGPNSLGKEFKGEISCMEELSQLNCTDRQGIDRGSTVRKKADRVLELLKNPDLRKDERTRARKVLSGILGFGSSLNRESSPDAVENQSRGRDSEGSSLSSHRLSEESVNAANEASQLGHTRAPFGKCPSLSSQHKQDNSSNLSGKENILATSQPSEEKSCTRLFNKSLSSPGYFRERLPHLGWQPAVDDVSELEEAIPCLLDAVVERASSSGEYAQEGRDVNGLLIGCTPDMLTEQGSRGDGMSTAPFENVYSGFEGVDVFSLVDGCCKTSMQGYEDQQQSYNFSNFPMLPQPARRPKLGTKYEHQWQPSSLIDCDAKFGKAA